MEAKETNGNDLNLLDLRSKLNDKLNAAGIQPIDESNKGRELSIQAERTGSLEIQLSGAATAVDYRKSEGKYFSGREQHFADVKLEGRITTTFGGGTQTHQFTTSRRPSHYLDGYYPTVAAAPYDRALFEDKEFLKLLFRHLQPIVGLDGAARAVICDWGIEKTNDAARDSVCAALLESRPDAKQWLLEELHVPCDTARRRVAAIVHREFPERSVPLLDVPDDSDANAIMAICRRKIPDTFKNEWLTHIHVVLATSHDEESEVWAARWLIKTATSRLKESDPQALPDLREALELSSGKAQAAIQNALDEIDPPFYSRPVYILAALAAVVIVGTIGTLIQQHTLAVRPQKTGRPVT